jgi:hypothetical protein
VHARGEEALQDAEDPSMLTRALSCDTPRAADSARLVTANMRQMAASSCFTCVGVQAVRVHQVGHRLGADGRHLQGDTHKGRDESGGGVMHVSEAEAHLLHLCDNLTSLDPSVCTCEMGG